MTVEREAMEAEEGPSVRTADKTIYVGAHTGLGSVVADSSPETDPEFMHLPSPWHTRDRESLVSALTTDSTTLSPVDQKDDEHSPSKLHSFAEAQGDDECQMWPLSPASCLSEPLEMFRSGNDMKSAESVPPANNIIFFRLEELFEYFRINGLSHSAADESRANSFPWAAPFQSFMQSNRRQNSDLLDPMLLNAAQSDDTSVLGSLPIDDLVLSNPVGVKLPSNSYFVVMKDKPKDSMDCISEPLAYFFTKSDVKEISNDDVYAQYLSEMGLNAEKKRPSYVHLDTLWQWARDQYLYSLSLQHKVMRGKSVPGGMDSPARLTDHERVKSATSTDIRLSQSSDPRYSDPYGLNLPRDSQSLERNIALSLDLSDVRTTDEGNDDAEPEPNGYLFSTVGELEAYSNSFKCITFKFNVEPTELGIPMNESIEVCKYVEVIPGPALALHDVDMDMEEWPEYAAARSMDVEYSPGPAIRHHRVSSGLTFGTLTSDSTVDNLDDDDEEGYPFEYDGDADPAAPRAWTVEGSQGSQFRDWTREIIAQSVDEPSVLVGWEVRKTRLTFTDGVMICLSE